MKMIYRIILAALAFLFLHCSAWAAAIPDVIFDDLEAAYRAFQEENYEQAIRLYTKIIMNRDLPARDRAITYLLRGEANKYREDLQAALDDFSRAVAIKPNYAQAFFFRGLTYESLGQFENAYKDVRMAISFKPNKAEYLQKLALLESKLPPEMQAEIAKARAEREKAMKLKAKQEAEAKARAEAAKNAASGDGEKKDEAGKKE